MTENYSFSIIPPPELVEQWMQVHTTKYDLARQAAQWGADQELEACIRLVEINAGEDAYDFARFVRAARRPKPPSLVEARAALSKSELDGPTDEELKTAYWEAFKDAAPCGAEESWLAGLRAVARWSNSMTDYKATPEQWAQCEDWVKSSVVGASDACILELRARVETLEVAIQKHIVETSANVLALASRIEALESAKRESSKVLDLSDLPQWTPEQVQKLKDLLGVYRNHLGLNE